MAVESTEKNLQGKVFVVSLLLVSSVAAGLTWMNYTAQAPSTTDASLLGDRLVSATFDARAARSVREGTHAIVTFESIPRKRFAGRVRSLETENSRTSTIIVLDEFPADVPPKARCEVTVDSSVIRGMSNGD